MESYLQKMAGTTNCATMKRGEIYKNVEILPNALISKSIVVKLSLEMKEMCTHIHRCNTNAVGQLSQERKEMCALNIHRSMQYINAVGQLSLCKERCVTGARTEL